MGRPTLLTLQTQRVHHELDTQEERRNILKIWNIRGLDSIRLTSSESWALPLAIVGPCTVDPP